jgi:hypothetical protein
VHLFIVSPLSFCTKNNLDQWYQSRLLLIILSACPRQGLSIASWVSSLSLKENRSRTPKKPSMAEENKNDGADDPIILLLEQALM